MTRRPPKRTDLIALDMGGNIERVPSEWDHQDWAAINLLGTLPHNTAAWSTIDGSFPKDFPQDLVFSFFGRQPALIDSVVIDSDTRNSKDHWAKDVEIWTSMDAADGSFTKVGQKALTDAPGDQTIGFPAVQARFVKIRILSNWGNQTEVQLGRVKVIEGQAPDYKSILERNSDLAALVKGEPFGKIVGSSPVPGPSVATGQKAAMAATSCELASLQACAGQAEIQPKQEDIGSSRPQDIPAAGLRQGYERRRSFFFRCSDLSTHRLHRG